MARRKTQAELDQDAADLLAAFAEAAEATLTARITPRTSHRAPAPRILRGGLPTLGRR